MRAQRTAAERPPSWDRGPSAWEGERVRPLTRCQVIDRLPDLGALYAANCGAENGRTDDLTRDFLWRLSTDLRRPGFGLLIAENTAMTACAYGFPLRRGLFEIREIIVPRRVRQLSPHLERNLARRLQRRLLADHGRATGVCVVDRSDEWTLAALRSWGWRDAPHHAYGIPLWSPRCALLLDP